MNCETANGSSPATSPVGAEEVVAAGATAACRVSRPCQAVWPPDASPSPMGLGVPVVGPGATVGTVETRVRRAGLPGPTSLPWMIFAKDQALQPGEPREGFFLGRDLFLLAEESLPRRGTATRQGVSDAIRSYAKDQAEGLDEAFCLAEAPSSRSHPCLRGRAHMGSAPCAE